jgi:DNA polymerase-3 subunit beta
MAIRAGRSRFTLQTLPEIDFPDLAAGEMTHTFKLPAADLKRLIDKTGFAISTEETRYYLNGIYLHPASTAKTATLRAVATDGHRLAQFELPLPAGANGMPGIIVPRKTVGEVQRLLKARKVRDGELPQDKIRFTIADAVLTSKLIDGTFPDYARVIPVGNDKELTVDKKEFEQAVDRVSTVSSERGRAVKLSLSNGKLTLSVTNPDSGSATEELEVEYGSEPIDIGFNSRYLLDIAAQLDGEAAVLKLSDPGSPTLIQDHDNKGALYVLMPMRV